MKKVVFTFGRMNPPTVGHQKLVDKVTAEAKKQSADARVYLSHTQNKKKDPLDYNSKVKYATKAFGSIVTKTNAKTIIQVLKELQSAGYTDVTLIVGSDRIPEFKKLLTKYNGKDYSFNSINFTSAGQRDPDAEGVEGMSASKMRALAMEGDLASFKSGLPKALQASAKEIYNKLRNIMEEEDKQLDEASLTLQQRQKRSRIMKRLAKKIQRKAKVQKRRMADSKRLQKRALKKAREMVRKKVAGEKGSRYASLSSAEKISIDKLVDKKQPLIAKIAKKLLPKVRRAEMERLKKVRGGSVNEEKETLHLPELNENQNLQEIDQRKEPNLYRALVAIDREKARDYQKFDRMRDTARVRDTIYRNRKEEVVDEVSQDKDIKDREGTQPAKYHSGLKKSTKATRDAQFKKGAEMDHKDPAAYPDKHAGDDTAKTRTSKHTKKYHDMFGEHREYELTEDSKAALMKKADKSGIPYSILKKVYDRGMAAWRTGHRPGAGQEQWAYARVNSFITKGKGTWGGADKDLAAKVKKESVEFDEACWDGYKQVGMKKKGDKMVPDCVPEAKNPAQQAAIAIAKKEKGIKEETITEGPIVMTRNNALKTLVRIADDQVGKMDDKQLKSFAQMLGKTINKQATGKYVVEEDQLDEAKSPINITRKDLDKINSSSLEQAKNIMHKLIQNAADKKTQKRPLRADKANVLKRSVDEKRSKDALLKMAWNMFMAGDDVGKKQGAGKVLFPSPPGQRYRKMFGEEVKELGPEGKAKEIKHKSTKKTMKDILPKSGAGQEGTDELVKTYKDATPGQGSDLSESVTGMGSIYTAKDLDMKTEGGFAYHPSVEEFVEEYEDWGHDQIAESAEYEGRKVKLNDPFRLPAGSKKKFGVYVKNDKGNVVKVQFGDPNMEIKRDDPKRRAAFRSRHSCDDNIGPKWKARYWSCYQWRAGKKVDN